MVSGDATADKWRSNTFILKFYGLKLISKKNVDWVCVFFVPSCCLSRVQSRIHRVKIVDCCHIWLSSFNRLSSWLTCFFHLFLSFQAHYKFLHISKILWKFVYNISIDNFGSINMTSTNHDKSQWLHSDSGSHETLEKSWFLFRMKYFSSTSFGHKKTRIFSKKRYSGTSKNNCISTTKNYIKTEILFNYEKNKNKFKVVLNFHQKRNGKWKKNTYTNV